MKGFTLIELLVVVLIIGILVSVALPQYRKAVLKARATEGLTLLRALEKAEDVYFLANGQYTTDLELLDIKIPDNMTCPTDVYCTVWTGKDISWEITFFHKKLTYGFYSLYCVANTEVARSVCEAFGARHRNGDIENYYLLPNL